MSNKKRIKGVNGAMAIFDELVEDKPGASIVADLDYPDVGAINGYRCDSCKKYILVIHADKGVTPMFLECKATEGCGGRSVSLMYPKTPMPDELKAKIQWEWYRPNQEEFNTMDEAMKYHLRQGGLALRRRVTDGLGGD